MPDTIPLDDPRFTTAQILTIARVPDKMFRSWGQDRTAAGRLMPLGTKHFSGRLIYTLSEVIQAAVMAALCRRAMMRPVDAAPVTMHVMEYVRTCTPPDVDGRAMLDVSRMPAGMAVLVAADDDGTPVTADTPRKLVCEVFQIGRSMPNHWSRAHICVPISTMVFDLLMVATTELERKA